MTAFEVEECGNEDIPIHVGHLLLLLHAIFCMQLSKAVNEVYHMYNRHQFPFTVLNITTDRGTYTCMFSKPWSWFFTKLWFLSSISKPGAVFYPLFLTRGALCNYKPGGRGFKSHPRRRDSTSVFHTLSTLTLPNCFLLSCFSLHVEK